MQDILVTELQSWYSVDTNPPLTTRYNVADPPQHCAPLPSLELSTVYPGKVSGGPSQWNSTGVPFPYCGLQGMLFHRGGTGH